MKPIKDCEKGDKIQHPGGNKYLVLGRLGDELVFLSESYDHKIAHYHPFTVHQLEKEGWKVLTPDGKEPMTIAEVEKFMGNVKVIKDGKRSRKTTNQDRERR